VAQEGASCTALLGLATLSTNPFPPFSPPFADPLIQNYILLERKRGNKHWITHWVGKGYNLGNNGWVSHSAEYKIFSISHAIGT